MKSLHEILQKSDDDATSRTNMPTSSSDDAHDVSANEIAGVTHGRARLDTARGDQTAKSASLLDDTCPYCGGTGFIVRDVPLGDPNFGKAVPCRCRQQENLERRIRSLQGISTISSLQRLTFANFIPEPSHLTPDKAYNLRRAYDTAVYFAQEPEGWLVLSGTFGCGKTHLAAAIANVRLDQGEPAIFMIVPDLLDHLRATFSPQSSVSYDNLFEQLRSAPLLILDDLGTQSSTPWAQEKLFQLLNHRYNAQLPTVITTNQRIDDLEPRLRSRLLDPSLVKHFPILAPDFRAGKNPVQSELSTLQLHREQTFEAFDARRRDLERTELDNLHEARNTCEHFADSPQGWLVLSGVHGCGKTHLAAAVANRVAASMQGDVMFIMVPDLLDHLRAAFSPQSTVPYDRRFDEVRKAPLLVLDDLGTESATPWAREKLYQLLNYRYNAQLPTIITTSATVDRIEPWLRTRMMDTERCKFYGIMAGAYRRSRHNDGQSGQSRRRTAR